MQFKFNLLANARLTLTDKHLLFIIGKQATDNVLQLLIIDHCNFLFVELELEIKTENNY